MSISPASVSAMAAMERDPAPANSSSADLSSLAVKSPLRVAMEHRDLTPLSRPSRSIANFARL